jgi:hypothetical protein
VDQQPVQYRCAETAGVQWLQPVAEGPSIAIISDGVLGPAGVLARLSKCVDNRRRHLALGSDSEKGSGLRIVTPRETLTALQ